MSSFDQYFGKTKGTVYLIKSDSGSHKIGHTRRNIGIRLSQLQSSSPDKLEVKRTFDALNSKETEQDLHSHFRSKNTHGEWFSLNEVDLQEFENYAQVYERQYNEVKSHLSK